MAHTPHCRATLAEQGWLGSLDAILELADGVLASSTTDP